MHGAVQELPSLFNFEGRETHTCLPPPCAGDSRNSLPKFYCASAKRIFLPPIRMHISAGGGRRDANGFTSAVLNFAILYTHAVEATLATPRAPKAAPLAVGGASVLKEATALEAATVFQVRGADINPETMETKVETTIVYWGYIAIMDKKMEATMMLSKAP